MYYFNEKYLFNRINHVHIKMEQQERLRVGSVLNKQGFLPFSALFGRKKKYPQQFTQALF